MSQIYEAFADLTDTYDWVPLGPERSGHMLAVNDRAKTV